jgi:hypothetical protein
MNIPEFSELDLSNQFRLNVGPQLELDDYDTYEKVDYEPIRKSLYTKLNNKFTVVGIDIYKYSEYAQLEQTLIPKLFDAIYKETNSLILQNFKYLFQKQNAQDDLFSHYGNFEMFFIGTGDGGYQILETPIHGIAYIAVFEALVRLYNSRKFMTKVYDIIGPITLRYAMTYDDLFKYGKSYYGSAIIKNARIIARDKLNRFLIDQNTYTWFQLKCIGVENIGTLTLDEISRYNEFKDYDDRLNMEEGNEIFAHSKGRITDEGIKSVDVQKLGIISEKSTRIDIYNVCIQVHSKYGHFLQQSEQKFSYTIGNQNSNGLMQI